MVTVNPNPVPVLSDEEYVALKDSILERGVLMPVLISAGPARPGELVDGFHRSQICEEMGLEVPTVTREFQTETEFLIAQIETNLQRRQLSVAQKIELGMRLEPLEKELSSVRMRTGAPSMGSTRDQVGRKLGMSGLTYERGSRVLRDAPDSVKDLFRKGEISVNEAWRRLNAAKTRAQVAHVKEKIETLEGPPEGPFDVVVVDPPWPSGSTPYPQDELKEIAKLPIDQIADDDAVVWIWCLNRTMGDALWLARQWNLTVQTILTWGKLTQNAGGNKLRGRTEHCLVCWKGKPLWNLGNQSTLMLTQEEMTLVYGKRREHSRKPDEFYELVEEICIGTRIDLYAREPREGWTVWGAEIDKFSNA